MADILSGIGSALRPLAKELIKGGICLYDAASELVSESGEQFKDLVAEAKADLAKSEKNGEPSEDAVNETNEADKDNGSAS
jgi:hypothetical protein